MSKKLDIGRKLDVQTRKRLIKLVDAGIPVQGEELGADYFDENYSKNWVQSVTRKISKHRERIARELFLESDAHKDIDNPTLYLSNAVLMRVVAEMLVKVGLYESVENLREEGVDDIIFAKVQRLEI